MLLGGSIGTTSAIAEALYEERDRLILSILVAFFHPNIFWFVESNISIKSKQYKYWR
jgi:hypothetical protein